MDAGADPSDVQLCEDHESRDEAYGAAREAGRPYLAVERYGEEYAVTYDLLTVGCELSDPAREELGNRLTREVESIVADDARPTVEVSRTVGPSLGSLGGFEAEADAREVAAVVVPIVRDESNWVEATPPEQSQGAEFRQN